MEKFKKISFIWIAVAALAVWGIFALVNDEERVELETYENTALGIRFSFLDTYRIESRELSDSRGEYLSVILIDKDFIPVEGGEGPPVIAFDFYKNPIEIPQTAREGTLAGKPAVYYLSDGLYAGDSVVVAHRDYSLLIQGQYMTAEDKIRQDFQEVLRSISFF